MDTQARKKLLDNACFILAKHYRKKLWPHPQPYQQRSSCNGYYEAPQLPCWVVSEANREQRRSSLLGRNRHGVSELPPFQEVRRHSSPFPLEKCQRRPNAEPELSPPPSIKRPSLLTLFMISWRPRGEQ